MKFIKPSEFYSVRESIYFSRNASLIPEMSSTPLHHHLVTVLEQGKWKDWIIGAIPNHNKGRVEEAEENSGMCRHNFQDIMKIYELNKFSISEIYENW